MVLKAVLFLLVLTLSQVIAFSILQPRSLEARQLPRCPRCNFTEAIRDCKVVSCICTPEIAAQVRECIGCALWIAPVNPNPPQPVIDSAHELYDRFNYTCGGTEVSVEWPGGLPFPEPARNLTRYPPTPTPGRSPSPATVTNTNTVQVTAPPAANTVTPPPGLPSVRQSGADKGIRTGFAVVAAMLGLTLVL